MSKSFIYQKVLSRIILSLSIERNVYDQPIDSDITWYEEMRKLTTSQGEDYVKGCFFGYECIKNHHRVIVNLSRQQELDVDCKAIQQIEFVG